MRPVAALLRPMSLSVRLGLLGWGMNISPVAKLSQVLLEKIVQKGSDHRDGAELPDLLPARRNRRPDDVGCQLEGESGDEPAPVAHQDLAEPLMCRGGKCRPQSSEKSLCGSDRDNDQRHRIDDDDGVFRGEMQPFLHRPLLRARIGRPPENRTTAPLPVRRDYVWALSCSFRSTSSRLKLAAFWRCGYSLKVAKNSPI